MFFSMISHGPGLRTQLSGSESKSMTHYLRMHHDAILIGGGTAVADDPSLNCRYPGATLEDQPQPVVVGAYTLPDNWLENCKATALAKEGKGKRPWNVRADHEPENRDRRFWDGDTLKIHIPTNGGLDWEVIFKELGKRGIKSIMIEGGAQVIKDLLQEKRLVDAVIITVAPVWLGKGGVKTAPPPAFLKDGARTTAAMLLQPEYFQFGPDVVATGWLYDSLELDQEADDEYAAKQAAEAADDEEGEGDSEED